MFFVQLFIIFGFFTLVWNAIKASTRAILVSVGLSFLVEGRPAGNPADVEKLPALDQDAIPEEERVSALQRTKLAISGFFATHFKRIQDFTTSRLAGDPLPVVGPLLPQDNTTPVNRSFYHPLGLAIVAFFTNLKGTIGKGARQVGEVVCNAFSTSWRLTASAADVFGSYVVSPCGLISDAASVASSSWATHCPASASLDDEFKRVFGSPRSSWTRALQRRDSVLNITRTSPLLPVATPTTISPIIVVDITVPPAALKTRREINQELRQQQLCEARERRSDLSYVSLPTPALVAGERRVLFAPEPEVRLYCPTTPEMRNRSRSRSATANDTAALSAPPTIPLPALPSFDMASDTSGLGIVNAVVSESEAPAADEVIVEVPNIATEHEITNDFQIVPTLSVADDKVEVTSVAISSESTEIIEEAVTVPADGVPTTEVAPEAVSVPIVAEEIVEKSICEEGISDEPDLSLLQAELDDGVGSASFQAELQQHPILQNILQSYSSSKLLHSASTPSVVAKMPSPPPGDSDVQNSNSSGSVSTTAASSDGSLNQLSSGVDSKSSSIADAPVEMVASTSAAVLNISGKARERLLEHIEATKVLQDAIELPAPLFVTASPAVHDLASFSADPNPQQLARPATARNDNRGWSVFGIKVVEGPKNKPQPQPPSDDDDLSSRRADRRNGLAIQSRSYQKLYEATGVELGRGYDQPDLSPSPELTPPALVVSPGNDTTPPVTTSPDSVVTPPPRPASNAIIRAPGTTPSEVITIPPITASFDALISPPVATPPDAIASIASTSPDVIFPTTAYPDSVPPAADSSSANDATSTKSRFVVPELVEAGSSGTGNSAAANASGSLLEPTPNVDTSCSVYSQESYPSRNHSQVFASSSRIVPIKRTRTVSTSFPSRVRPNSGILSLCLPAIIKARERKETADAQREAAKTKAKLEAEVAKGQGLFEVERRPARRDLKLPSIVAARDASFIASSSVRLSRISNAFSDVPADTTLDGPNVKRAKLEELIDALGLCGIQPCADAPRDAWISGIHTGMNDGLIAAPSTPEVSFMPSFEGVETSLPSSPVQERRKSVEEVLLSAMGLEDESFVSPGEENVSPWNSIYVVGEDYPVEHYSIVEEEEGGSMAFYCS